MAGADMSVRLRMARKSAASDMVVGRLGVSSGLSLCWCVMMMWVGKNLSTVRRRHHLCLVFVTATKLRAVLSAQKHAHKNMSFTIFLVAARFFPFPLNFHTFPKHFSCFVDFSLGLSISFVNMKNVFDVR
jgi:hypothetical protein